MGFRNRVGIGLSYRPTRLQRLANSLEWIPWLLKSLKIRSQVAVSGAMVTAASEQVLETAVAVGVNPQTPAFTGKFLVFFAYSSYVRKISIFLEMQNICADQKDLIFKLFHTKITLYKRLAIFPSPIGMPINKLSLARNNLIIFGQGEFV
jgi:hypothetical protein